MSLVRRFAIGVVLAIAIGAPVLETFDRWDQTLQDGNDTEINLVIVALCVGVAFAVARALLAAVRAPMASSRGLPHSAASTACRHLALIPPSPNSRPPTALRI